MPFRSKSQRRLFYKLHAEGKISDETLKHWEDSTPKGKKLPERLHKKAELDYAHVARHVPIDDLLKLAADPVSVLKSLGKSGLNLNRYLGEAVINLGIGGKGGIEAGQIMDPLFQELGHATKPIVKWEPAHGISNLGRLKKYHKDGLLKGSTMYEDGAVAYKQDNPSVGRRIANLPEYTYQQLRGDRPTRADFLIHDLAKEKGLTPGEYHKQMTSTPEGAAQLQKALQERSTKSVGSFIKDHPMDATKYYGTKGLWGGAMVGWPAYEAAQIAAGEGDKSKTTAQNLGETVGNTTGTFTFMPIGLAGGLAGMTGLSYLGGKAGAGIGKLMGQKPQMTPEEWAASQQTSDQ